MTPADADNKRSPDQDETASAPGSMSLIEHLEELRSVIVHTLIAAAAATMVCWFFSSRLLDILVGPIAEYGVYFNAPNEAFLTRIKISAVVGLFLVLPYIFFKAYSFVIPGLYVKERRVVTPLLLATTGLFYLGVAFSFLVVTPQVIRFMLGFGTEYMEPLIAIGSYFAFVARLCLAFGVIFELPLVVLFLSMIGLVDPRWLLSTWRYAVVIIVVFAALLTPPDAVSQLMMAVPVTFLYVSSILISIMVTRNRRRAEEEPEDPVAEATEEETTEETTEEDPDEQRTPDGPDGDGD